MPEPLLVYATQAGGTTKDRDARGGNPFASALIDAVPSCFTAPRSRLLLQLGKATHQFSERHQRIECIPPAGSDHTPLLQGRTIALVLICSAYEHLPALPGAAFDKQRLAVAFAQHGLSVLQNHRDNRDALQHELAEFARVSARYDAALLYCTGHGLQHRGTQYLLPADIRPGVALNGRAAVPMAHLLRACRARLHNAVCFAGCRELYAPMPAA